MGMVEGVFPFAKTRCIGERPTRSAVCTSSGPSLAAALLDGLFEHPAGVYLYCATRAGHRSSSAPTYFFRILLGSVGS
jgi:hypothetical protein